MDIFASNEIRIGLNLVLAALFGGLIGLERQANARPAGFRTHILICVGSAAFGMIGVLYFPLKEDISRIWQNIITGIGFLGAGAVIKEGGTVRGLTTAADIWATAAIGLALAGELYVLALATEVIVLFTLYILRRVEERAELGEANHSKEAKK